MAGWISMGSYLEFLPQLFLFFLTLRLLSLLLLQLPLCFIFLFLHSIHSVHL